MQRAMVITRLMMIPQRFYRILIFWKRLFVSFDDGSSLMVALRFCNIVTFWKKGLLQIIAAATMRT